MKQLTEQEFIDKACSDLADYFKDIYDHNNNIIESLGESAVKDFDDLIQFTDITDKIELVYKPSFKPEYSPDVYGIFTLTHVDQWSTGMEGDSFSGFMYAKIKGQNKWLKIPYSC